jgi:hypothetical protein
VFACVYVSVYVRVCVCTHVGGCVHGTCKNATSLPLICTILKRFPAPVDSAAIKPSFRAASEIVRATTIAPLLSRTSYLGPLCVYVCVRVCVYVCVGVGVRACVAID